MPRKSAKKSRKVLTSSGVSEKEAKKVIDKIYEQAQLFPDNSFAGWVTSMIAGKEWRE